MKTFRGVIENWQLHHLSIKQELVDEVYPGHKAKPMVFTGTIVQDTSHRRLPGDHMKSSLIVKVDEEQGTIETLNSYYEIIGEEGGDIFKDLGNAVMSIRY